MLKRDTHLNWLLQNELNVLDCSTLFVLICHILTDVIQYGLIELLRLKIHVEWLEEKWKLLWVSRRFKLARFWGTKGKIAVNVWWKSRENRFWFELAHNRFKLMRVWVIGSQLYTIKFVVRIFILWRWQHVRRVWILSDYA